MIEFRNVSKFYDTPRGRKHLLRDFSLVIPKGAKLALMGRNGAGKSSMLGMISGTVPPSQGRIICDGTMSWPMGFSGGFAADMTGRQNTLFVARIYCVNADRLLKFVEAFSELGGFIDMPLRSYSSGMRARLAFGISMGLGFDWYLIDEVTSVGDSAFRKKSLETFQSRLSDSGLIMVSHSLSTLREYCSSAIVLENGGANYYEDLEQAIEYHEKNMAKSLIGEIDAMPATPEYSLTRAKALIKAEDFDAAEEHIASALLIDPEAAEGYALMAQIAHKLGDNDTAISRYKQAVAFQNEPKFHMALAKIYMTRDELDEAIESLGQVVVSDSSNASAEYLLGRVHYQRGDLASAEEHLIKSLKFYPDTAGANRILAQIHDGRRDFHRSVAFHAEVARLQPSNTAFLKGYARALEQCGRQQEAAAVLSQISAIGQGEV